MHKGQMAYAKLSLCLLRQHARCREHTRGGGDDGVRATAYGLLGGWSGLSRRRQAGEPGRQGSA